MSTARVRENNPGSPLALLRATATNFGADAAGTYAAAIAYSAVFAIVPLLIVGIGIAGQALVIARGGHQHHVVEDQMIAGLASAVGSKTADAVRQMVDASFASHQGSMLAQLLGWITFAIGASGLFLALQNALNKIWHVSATGGIVLTIKNRAISIAMLAIVGAIVILTIGLNIALSYGWTRLVAAMPFPGSALVLAAVHWIVLVVLVTIVFAILFKVLPDTEVGWHEVRLGAVVSAVLFVVGEALVGIYIRRAGLSNGYGAAGSLVVLLVWVYYSATLLLFGAEFTRTYAEACRTPAA
jgi:membrane protein